ncbi:MAG TPA: TlpA family protein disulfide reductase [Chitinophagaceae bacterium]
MAESQLKRAYQSKSADTSSFDFIPIRHQQLKKKKIDFIVSHPASYISSNLLSIETRSKSFTTEETLKLFAKLSKDQQNSENGEIILKSIRLYREVKIGDQAPSFSMKDEKNKEVNINYYKGKTVLFLFWASWCGPCRAEAPYFKEVYEKYKNTGFEIIAIFLDEDESKWGNFIKTGKFKWINISDLKGWANEAALIYCVATIPDNFLIDGQGKIIGRDLLPKQLEKSLEALKN